MGQEFDKTKHFQDNIQESSMKFKLLKFDAFLCQHEAFATVLVTVGRVNNCFTQIYSSFNIIFLK